MAANTIYNMEAVNLYAGDHDPIASKHLTLQELKLPAMQAIFSDHHPGGSFFGTEVQVGAEKLELGFKLGGVDPDLFKSFGLMSPSPERKRYTAYGYIIDMRTGAELESIAVFEGRLGKVEPDAWQRGEFLGCDYAVNSVTHYSLKIGTEELWAWDLFEARWDVAGVDAVAARNRILRIPQTNI